MACTCILTHAYVFVCVNVYLLVFVSICSYYFSEVIYICFDVILWCLRLIISRLVVRFWSNLITVTLISLSKAGYRSVLKIRWIMALYSPERTVQQDITFTLPELCLRRQTRYCILHCSILRLGTVTSEYFLSILFRGNTPWETNWSSSFFMHYVFLAFLHRSV